MGRILGWLFIISSFGMLYLWQPEFFQQAYSLLRHGDVAALADYLTSFGMLSVVVTILLFVVMTFTIVFPFMILSGAAGIMYGLFWGVVISWVGEVIGAVVMFVFARYCFRKFMENLLQRNGCLQQVDNYSASNGFKALLIARLLPLAPSGIITAVAAISKISFKDFFWATLLGKLPPVIIKVILGHDLVAISENMTRFSIVVALIIIVYAGLWYKRCRNGQCPR